MKKDLEDFLKRAEERKNAEKEEKEKEQNSNNA